MKHISEFAGGKVNFYAIWKYSILSVHGWGQFSGTRGLQSFRVEILAFKEGYA